MNESLTYYLNMVDQFSGPSQRAVNSIGGMDDKMRELTESRQKAASLQSDIQNYDRLSGRLSDHSEKLEEAKRKLTELGRENANSERLTQRQIKAFDDARKKVDQLTQTQTRYRGDLRELSGQLASVGATEDRLFIARRRSELQLRQYDRQIESHGQTLINQQLTAQQNADAENLLNARRQRAQDYLQERELRRTRAHDQQIENQMNEHNSRIRRMRLNMDRFNEMRDKAGSMSVPAAAIAGVGLGGLAAIYSANSEAVDSQRTAAGFGMDSELWAANGMIGKSMGGDAETIADLREEMGIKLGEMFNNGEQGQLDELAESVGGVDFKAIQAMNSQDQFLAITDAINSIDDTKKRQYFYDSILGGEGAKLSQILDEQGKSYRQLSEENKRYNLGTKAGAAGLLLMSQSQSRFSSVVSSGTNEMAGVIGKMLAPQLDVLTDQFHRMYTDNKTGMVDFITSTVSGLMKFGGWIVENRETIGEVLKWAGYFTALTVAVKTSAFVFSGAMAVMSGASAALVLWQTSTGLAAAGTGILAKGMMFLNAAMTANPVGLIVVGITAAAAACYLLYKNWDTVCEMVMSRVQWLKEGFTSLFDPIIEKINWVMNAGSGLFDGAKSAISSGLDFIGLGDDTPEINSNAVVTPIKSGGGTYTSQDTYQITLPEGDTEAQRAMLRQELERIEREKRIKQSQTLGDF